MKALPLNKKMIFLLATAFGFSSLSAQSTNSIAQSSGISDGMLLTLMIGFALLLLAIIQALSSSIKSISKPVKEGVEKSSAGSEKAKIGLLLVGLASANASFAAGKDGAGLIPEFSMTNDIFWWLLSLIILEMVVIFILFRSLQTLIRLEKGESIEEVEEAKEDIFESLNLTDRVPVEEEESILMDHEYDGIRELDNNLPPWWKYMFYATIIFAVVYIIRFHITGSGQLSHEEYAAEMEAAVAEKATMMAEATDLVNEDNVVYLVDAPSIEKGAAIYKGNCATCHGQLGEGGAGPNLTDQYWLHGGNIKNVFKTIKYGVPAKGMIAWESQFSPKQMQAVASYVLSLQGTNPPNQKDPQGEIFVEEFENEEGDSTTVVVEVD